MPLLLGHSGETTPLYAFGVSGSVAPVTCRAWGVWGSGLNDQNSGLSQDAPKDGPKVLPWGGGRGEVRPGQLTAGKIRDEPGLTSSSRRTLRAESA